MSAATEVRPHAVARARGRVWPWVVLVVAAVVAMWPVWASPVQSDDRYWYLTSTGHFDGSVAAVVANVVPDADPSTSGRVTPVAYLVRRLVSMALLEAAQVTAVPLGVWHGLLKVLTFALAVVASYGLVAALRWRSVDGLVPVSRGTRAFVLAGLVAGVAAGAQTQAPARNAWVAYPVLTVGGVAVVLGVMTVLVLITRLVARAGPVGVAVSVVVGALLGLLLNTTYELFYVAVPAATLLVLLLPATADGTRRAEVRAKAVGLVPFLLSFTVLFVAVRAAISAACQGLVLRQDGVGEEEACYVGTQPEVGPGLVVTAVRNFLGSVPGAGRTELLDDLAAVGAGTPPPLVTPVSLLLGAAVLTGLLGVLLARGAADVPAAAAEARPAGRAAATGVGEAGVLLRTAVVLVLLAVGAAGLMALSVQAQEVIQGLGQPYRHTVLTWVALVLAALLACRALVLTRPVAGRWATVGLAVALAVLVTLGWSTNTAATWAARQLPAAVAVTVVHHEVLRADVGEGDARRCEAVALLQRDLQAPSVRRPLLRGADDVYRLYHGEPFCSQGYGDDAPP